MSTSEQPANKVWYDANCHCRRVRLRLHVSPLYPSAEEGGSPAEPAKIINCNCSICTKNGYLNIYPDDPDGDVEWVSGKDELNRYEFAKGNVGHLFCPNCGSSIVLLVDTSKWEKGGRPKVGVNVSSPSLSLFSFSFFFSGVLGESSVLLLNDFPRPVV